MSAALAIGLLLGTGLVLLASPWLWPRREKLIKPHRKSRVQRLVDESGFAKLRVHHVFAATIGLAMFAAATAWLFSPLPIMAFLAAIAGASLPTLVLRHRRHALRKQRRSMWPDVCDLLVAGIRAGLSLTDAVTGLAHSGPVPLRPAFAEFAREITATGSFDRSAVRLKDTLADPVADRIIESLRMARQVGGTELTGVLRALSQSVRAETALRSEVEARQSWIRGAAVLGVSAPWVVLLLLSSRPEGAAAYSTPEGLAIIVFGAAASVIAFRLMLLLGRLREAKRWFA